MRPPLFFGGGVARTRQTLISQKLQALQNSRFRLILQHCTNPSGPDHLKNGLELYVPLAQRQMIIAATCIVVKVDVPDVLLGQKCIERATDVGVAHVQNSAEIVVVQTRA